MKVEEVRGLKARCTAMGEERWVDLMLMADDLPQVGDYLHISLGFAQDKIREEDALKAYEMFDEILEAMGPQD